jgi:hypothetical protein
MWEIAQFRVDRVKGRTLFCPYERVTGDPLGRPVLLLQEGLFAGLAAHQEEGGEGGGEADDA